MFLIESETFLLAEREKFYNIKPQFTTSKKYGDCL